MKQNGLGLFHLILRNRNIKKQEHLWCAVTALNKVIGRQSFRIASAMNSEEDNLFHLGLDLSFKSGSIVIRLKIHIQFVRIHCATKKF